MRKLPDLPSGVYRHYKGPLYFVFGYAHDANALDLFQTQGIGPALEPMGDRAVVVYMALELTDAHTGPRLAVRTARDGVDAFWDDVHVGNPERFTEGTVCDEPCRYRRINNDTWGTHMVVPRFTYIGPTWEGHQ